MSKRKLDEVIAEEAKLKEEEKIKKTGREMQGQGDDKHTIDSDDEDDEREKEKTFAKLKDDDIEGQEDNTMNMDGDIKITPFNLKEEQEEGSFSADGNFVWNDKNDELKDAWLDDIDWIKVKERSTAELQKAEEEDEKEEENQGKYNEIQTYREILKVLKPKESVAKALRRLGGNKKPLSSAERWKRKKAGYVEDPAEKAAKESMLALTGLADTIITRSGNMEVYDETYESITYRIQEQEKKDGPKIDIPENVDDDDALDMFGDSFDDKPKQKEPSNGNSEPSENKESSGDQKPKVETGAMSLDDEVMWVFKWKKEEDAELQGPFSSTKMLEWADSGYFKDGVWCRQADKTGDFSSSKRIDFDLYT